MVTRVFDLHYGNASLRQQAIVDMTRFYLNDVNREALVSYHTLWNGAKDQNQRKMINIPIGIS